MARFLIEIPHESTVRECTRAVELFLRTGSHYLTHADWGCKDGDHRSWIIVDVDGREEARRIVPSPYRVQAKIVQLNRFDMRDFEGKAGGHNA